MLRKSSITYFFRLIILSFLNLISFNSIAENLIEYKNSDEALSISSSLLILEDKSGNSNLNDILLKDFSPTTQTVLNLGISESVFWIKINIKNARSR